MVIHSKMDIAVFGTGYVFKKYQDKIGCNICCLVDNALEKQGKVMDGIRVIAPQQLCEYSYTYIVVMAFGYEEIEQQLGEMGIPGEKILNYTHISAISGNYPLVHVKENTQPLADWLAVNRGKKVLLAAHDFSYTGVPVALMNMAVVLKTMGYAVLIAGLTGGKLVRELKKNKIDYLEELNIFYGTDYFGKMASLFDYIVAGTLVLNKFVRRCSTFSNRILWWLHESDRRMYDDMDFSWLSENIKIYGGGKRVIDVFRMYHTGKDIGSLLYFLPETKLSDYKTDTGNKITFAVIGVISHRKAQDIVVDAVRHMPQRYRGSFQCLIIGAPSGMEPGYCAEIENEITGMDEVKRIGELDQEQLDQSFNDIDVLLCPSRDDPMPIVVTQAMMHGKVCIVSENVGQAEYIRQAENGFVFKNENMEELAGYMIWVMEHKKALYDIGECSRMVYKEKFSAEVMEKNIRDIFARWDD